MVVVTNHARQRYRERGGEGQLTAGRVRRHLQAQLRDGVVPGPDLDAVIPIGDGFRAVCVPEVTGGWVVLTVFREQEAS